MRLLVTGGCGFIGSHFIRGVLAARKGVRIVNLDALTYAGNPANLDDAANTFLKYARLQRKRDDLLEAEELESICMKRDPEPRTVADVLDAIRKQAKALYDGKAKAGVCQTPEVKKIVDAATKQLKLIADAAKQNATAEGVEEAA